MTTKLPRAIQEQLDQADALQKELYQEENSSENQNSETEQPAPAEDAPPAADELNDEQGQQEAQDTPAAPVAETPQKPADEDWKQRYKTLQSKYNAEVPRLHSQVQQLSADLKAAIERLDAAKAKEPEPPMGVTPKDTETFGSDLVEFTTRVAKGESAAEAKAAKQAAEAAAKQVEEIARRQAHTEYLTYLGQVGQRMPDWEAVNAEDGFLSWLAEYDPLVRGQRQLALDAAAQARDVEATVKIFETYKLTRKPAQPAPQVPPKAVREQVSPRSTGGQAPAAPEDKRIYSQQEISQLLSPQRLFKLPLAEQQRIEREIDLAAAEGRIR